MTNVIRMETKKHFEVAAALDIRCIEGYYRSSHPPLGGRVKEEEDER
jgi:hypothetical protein